jgi:hypothetical protein
MVFFICTADDTSVDMESAESINDLVCLWRIPHQNRCSTFIESRDYQAVSRAY